MAGWAKIESSEQYQGMSPEDQARLKARYFETRVQPKLADRDETEIGQIREHFLGGPAPDSPAPASLNREAAEIRGYQKPRYRDSLREYGREAAEHLLFGFGDSIAQGTAAGLAKVTGRDKAVREATESLGGEYEGVYDDIQGMEDAGRKEFLESNPPGVMATQLGAAVFGSPVPGGGVLPTGGAAAKAYAAANPVKAVAAKQTAEGAVEGAVTGLGMSEEGNRLSGLTTGATTGAALGGVTGATLGKLSSRNIAQDIDASGTQLPLTLVDSTEPLANKYRSSYGRTPGANAIIRAQERPHLLAAEDAVKEAADVAEDVKHTTKLELNKTLEEIDAQRDIDIAALNRDHATKLDNLSGEQAGRLTRAKRQAENLLNARAEQGRIALVQKAFKQATPDGVSPDVQARMAELIAAGDTQRAYRLLSDQNKTKLYSAIKTYDGELDLGIANVDAKLGGALTDLQQEPGFTKYASDAKERLAALQEQFAEVLVDVEDPGKLPAEAAWELRQVFAKLANKGSYEAREVTKTIDAAIAKQVPGDVWAATMRDHNRYGYLRGIQDSMDAAGEISAEAWQKTASKTFKGPTGRAPLQQDANRLVRAAARQREDLLQDALPAAERKVRRETLDARRAENARTAAERQALSRSTLKAQREARDTREATVKAATDMEKAANKASRRLKQLSATDSVTSDAQTGAQVRSAGQRLTMGRGGSKWTWPLGIGMGVVNAPLGMQRFRAGQYGWQGEMRDAVDPTRSMDLTDLRIRSLRQPVLQGATLDQSELLDDEEF